MMKKAKRFLSMLLTLSLCVGEFSFMGIKASAEGGKTITGLGTGAITDPVAPAADTDAWGGSFVYYGKYNGQPVKYRVLDKDSADFGVEGGSLFLDCDSTLEEKRYDDDSNDWGTSEIRAWLNGEEFLFNDAVFSNAERSAVAPSTKEERKSDYEVRYGDRGLSNDLVFLLDFLEVRNASYGYSNSWPAKNREKKGVNSEWLLRSYYYEPVGYSSVSKVVYVEANGIIYTVPYAYTDVGVSPAFNLRLPSVIFSSAVTGTAGQPGAEYKLTLKDSDLMIAADKAVMAGENKILIPYTIEDNSDSAEPGSVSVVVTDGTWTDKGWSTGAKLLQYAQLDTSAFSLSGSGTFTLDSSITGKWGKDYHVYVLAEDVNGNYESDYASAPVEVKELIEKACTVTFDLNGKEGTAPAAQSVPEGGKASEPSGVMVTGYNAEGWYKEAACTNKWDFANDTVTADITLYAKWAPVNYTVKYDPNKPAAALSDVSGTTEDSTHTYDEAKALSANGYRLEGYTFSSWNTVADGSGTGYAGGASVKNLADTEGATITLYAQWKEYTHSALDSVPEIKDDTTQLWLVKGQKFTLQGWSLDDKDKDKLKAYKKLISINKKGSVKVKNTGTAVIVKKDESGNIVQSISANITKPELTNKKLKLEAGVAGKDTGSIALKNVDNIDVYYYSASPDVALVDQDGNVTAVGKGSAKITAYANGVAYTATVSVKETSAVKERTLHLSTGGSKSVKLSGVKKTVWDYAEGTTEEEKAIVSLKGAKVTGEKAGIVTLVARDAVTSYIMTVKVDDPTITAVHEEDKYDLAKSKGKNKYALTIISGQKMTLGYTYIDQPVIYKSSKPDIAFIDENGNIEARGAGKAKFTAKVNGKAITISVNVK